jgi:hypothetical protein
LTLFIKILLFYWDVPNHYFCVVPIGPSNWEWIRNITRLKFPALELENRIISVYE